jgi:excisionase family DNA binding protein
MSEQHASPPLPPDPRDNGSLLTVNEVAVMLEVSKMTVYRLIAAGLIPSYRIGRANRLPRASVNQFLRDTRRNPHIWPRSTPKTHPTTDTEHSHPREHRPYQPPHKEIIDEYSV